MNNPWGADYWDRVAEKRKSPFFHEQVALYKKKDFLGLVSRWGASFHGKRILKTDLFEEAYGEDSLLDEFNSNSASGIGIDISRVIAREAKKRLPDTPLLVTDVCSLCLKGESFDLVVSNSTLDHIEAFKLSSAIDEIWRVLKPGGYLILTIDNRHNPFNLFAHLVGKWIGAFHTERCYTVREMTGLLNACRFQILDVGFLYHLPVAFNLMAKITNKIAGNRLDKLLHHVINICSRIGDYPTRFFTGAFIAMYARKVE